MRSLMLALLLVCASAVAQDKPTVQSDKAQKPSVAESQIDEKALIGSSVDAALKIAISEGWTALKRGDAEIAIKLFNKAAGMNPHSADAYWGLGAATAHQGKFDISIHSFERARKLDPKNLRLAADGGLAHTYFAMSQPESSAARTKGLNDAFARFDEAVKLDPNFAQAYANRAIALAFSGDYDGAWKNVEKAESLDMTSVDPRLISYLSEKQPRPAPKPLPLVQTAVEPTPPPAPPVQLEADAKPAVPPTQPMPETKPDAAAKPAQSETAAPAQAAQQASIPAALAAAAAVTGKPAPQPEIQQLAQQKKPAEPAEPSKPETKPEKKTVQEPEPVAPAKAETKPGEETVQKPEPAQTTEPAPEKKLKVISGTPARQKGADKRPCLDLQTNEEIIRCVYPRQ